PGSIFRSRSRRADRARTSPCGCSTKRRTNTMRNLLSLIAVLSLPGLASAQSWEVGADAGYGFYRHADVTNGSLTGKTGFESGAAFGAVLGNQFHSIVGGEARYTFQINDLMLSAGSTKATVTGQSHALHYDVLIHANRPGAAVRPFVAAGAGVKWFRGTGDERVFQPLSNLVALSHTHEAKPLVSVGGGIKIK